MFRCCSLVCHKYVICNHKNQNDWWMINVDWSSFWCSSSSLIKIYGGGEPSLVQLCVHPILHSGSIEWTNSNGFTFGNINITQDCHFICCQGWLSDYNLGAVCRWSKRVYAEICCSVLFKCSLPETERKSFQILCFNLQGKYEIWEVMYFMRHTADDKKQVTNRN